MVMARLLFCSISLRNGPFTLSHKVQKFRNRILNCSWTFQSQSYSETVHAVGFKQMFTIKPSFLNLEIRNELVF